VETISFTFTLLGSGSTVHSSPQFSPSQNRHITGRTLQLLLNNGAKWSVKNSNKVIHSRDRDRERERERELIRRIIVALKKHKINVCMCLLRNNQKERGLTQV
jgi:hypothetical protein